MARNKNTTEQRDGSIVKRVQLQMRANQKEALRCYRPATRDQLAIHQSTAHELIVRGGKRSAKSTCGFAEFASRVTGIPIKGRLTTPHWRKSDFDDELDLKFPVPTKEDPKLYWIIGWDLKHIGQTIHRILFEPGLFRVIWDADLQDYRPWNPADPEDGARYDQSEPAGPLIPPRLIEPDSWVWDAAAGGASENIFRTVHLRNGAKICTYPSSAKGPKMGDPVDGLLIDEDIQNPDFLDEWQDRLTDHNGWFMWTVWPKRSNYALIDLIDRAEEERDDPDKDIEEVQLDMRDNPFVEESAKRRALKRMGSEEAIARRARGELLLNEVQMYDFRPTLHGISPSLAPDKAGDIVGRQLLLSYILKNDGQLPHDWTRYISIDPSHTRSAIMMFAVPPIDYRGFNMRGVVVAEGEMVLRQCGPEKLALGCKELIGQRRIEAFIMDKMIGRQTRVGSNTTVFQTYQKAFAKANLVSRVTKSGFIPGCNQPATRNTVVRELMRFDGGESHIFFMYERMPHTCREFQTYRKKQGIVAGELQIYEEAANPRKHDCMAALEYGCAYLHPLLIENKAYVSPNLYTQQTGTVKHAATTIRGLLEKHNNNGTVHLGPGDLNPAA